MVYFAFVFVFLLINPNKYSNVEISGNIGESVWTGLLLLNFASKRILFRYEDTLMWGILRLFLETVPSPQPSSFGQYLTFLYFPFSRIQFHLWCLRPMLT